MDQIGAAPGFLTQPNRALVHDEGRLQPTSIVGEAGEAASPPPKFSDLVAILNPLQHLPIVGAIYRHLTGDVPHPAARVIGGLIFGGPMGLMGAVLTAAVEQVSGKSSVEMVMAAFKDADGDAKPHVAQISPEVTDAAGEPGKAEASQPAPAATARTATPPPELQRDAAPPGAAAATATARAPAAAPGAIGDPGTRPRNAAHRDLAFYQAHAGARLPPAGTTMPSPGPQQPPQLPGLQRVVSAVPIAEPSAARPAAKSPQHAADFASTSTPSPAGPDFAQRMLQGLERYRALHRASEIRPPVLDRVE